MPFTVLHVCMGNICRSPMAERLLVLAAGQRLGKLDPAARLTDLLVSRSAGTGGWHEGEEMNPPAARQIRVRGGNVEGFAARKLTGAQLSGADLILTATADQSEYVHALVPGTTHRTFVLGHLGRLLRELDDKGLPAPATDPAGFADRARAVVAAADQLRADAEPLPADDLDDPWGRGDQTFQRIADDIEESLHPLVDVLLPGAPRSV
ncbi:low molecular weight phosphotyrosine protein phosphatase [Actinoplanes sp. N902-109]|uniref:arsenate reductase/protein-tyrosine-phosphatase family protein n=1 Tax=Actinoplanes sp. (strain N902-109) TaxID=649831 RepID=UPI00032962A4|nr:low molecular weight phosphotyrosine protein phosphatase [Actinoplanes sp. N902-109]AGL20584.1 low molecular weight phosphotyrosine protein phosphatase [Actinoplanes sp. N902-109]